MESRVYRYASAADAAADTNGVDLGSLFGNWYQDIDVTIGASYWYRVRHYDRSGNSGPLSAPVSLTVRGPRRTDNISINTDNLITDADCADLSQWTVTQSNNDLTRLDNIGNFGPGRYKLRATGTSVNFYTALIPVPRNGTYRFSCYVGPEDGNSYDVGIDAKPFYRNASGVLVEGYHPDATVDGFATLLGTTKAVSALTLVSTDFMFYGDHGVQFIQIKIRVLTASSTRQLNIASPSLIPVVGPFQILNKSVAARHLMLSDTSNMLPDNALVDDYGSWELTRCDTDYVGNRNILIFNQNFTAAADGTYIGGAYSLPFGVTPGTVLKYGGVIDFDGSLSQGCRLYLRFLDLFGNEVSNAQINRSTATTLSPEEVSSTVTVPADAYMAQIYVRRQVPANGGTSAGSLKVYNLYVFRMASTDQIPTSAVTQKYQALTSGSVTLTTTAQTIQTDNVTWGADFEWLVLDASFYVGANASNIPIVVEFAIGSTVLQTVSTMTLANGVAMIKRGFSAAAIAAITSATSGTINVTARTTTGTLAISVRTLLSMVFKR